MVITDRAPVQKLDDLFKRELVIGASASGSASVDFPAVTNAILGTKFKIVSGYPAANVVVKIAMPAGEVDGCSVYTLSGLRTQLAREYAEGKVRILAQWGMKQDPQIPDVPLMPLGKTKDDHQLFELLYARGNYGRPYMLPPGVPPERVAALRQAFAAVFKDPAFKAEVEKQKLEVDFISADEIAGLTERVMATPPSVVARIQALLPGGGAGSRCNTAISEPPTCASPSSGSAATISAAMSISRPRARVIHKALDLGVTFFDTSDVYGRRGGSETIIGEVLGARRKDIVLATKFGRPMDAEGKLQGGSRAYIMFAVEASLKRLKTDWIDLYQSHKPDPLTPIEETLRALDDLVRAGKVRAIGSSHMPAAEVREALPPRARTGLPASPAARTNTASCSAASSAICCRPWRQGA